MSLVKYSKQTNFNYVSPQNVHGREIEQGLTSHQTHYRPYWGRVFTGQMTQPTVSEH